MEFTVWQGLALELSADYPNAEITIVPGITAALSGGAVLGAPLTHDFAVISLSDLLIAVGKNKKNVLNVLLLLILLFVFIIPRQKNAVIICRKPAI